ncbi:hypothetical protein D3C86_1998040 [compost metagenome]
MLAGQRRHVVVVANRPRQAPPGRLVRLEGTRARHRGLAGHRNVLEVRFAIAPLGVEPAVLVLVPEGPVRDGDDVGRDQLDTQAAGQP